MDVYRRRREISADRASGQGCPELRRRKTRGPFAVCDLGFRKDVQACVCRGSKPHKGQTDHAQPCSHLLGACKWGGGGWKLPLALKISLVPNCSELYGGLWSRGEGSAGLETSTAAFTLYFCFTCFIPLPISPIIGSWTQHPEVPSLFITSHLDSPLTSFST